MRARTVARQSDIKFDVTWTSLGEYLDYLVDRGVSPNIASFVGATTVRIHEIGFDSAADTITLRHQARSRVGFASGALTAARWLAGKSGFYEFSEVLFGGK